MTNTDADPLLQFVDDDEHEHGPDHGASVWRVLIVDDEQEVHSVTKLALADFEYSGRGLEFLSAYSGESARRLLADNPDIAVVFLDVVMEEDDSGLQLADYVRHELGNNFLRIILRTGHPGLAPEREVIRTYDINDYRAKTELTQDRMHAVLYNALSSYQQLILLARSRYRFLALANEHEEIAQVLGGGIAERIEGMAEALEPVVTDADLKQRIDKELATAQAFVRAVLAVKAVDDRDDPVDSVNLGELLSEEAERLAEDARAPALKLDTNGLPTVYAHPRMLRQAMQELVRFLATHCAAGPVEVTARARGRNWLVSIALAGVDLPAHAYDRAFELFQAGSDGVTTAVGPAICAKVITWHGGRIWLEPAPGGGAVVRFSLPAGDWSVQ